MDASLVQLRDHVRRALSNAYTPYSGVPRAAAMLLSDGRWACGVRVENVSFSLTIPALGAAYSICASAGRRDIVAVALSGPARPDEQAFLESAFAGLAKQHASDAFTLGHILPAIGNRLHSYVACPNDLSAADGIALARKAAGWAFVPASSFPVGCVIKTSSGRLYSGANIEHDDWTRISCAERSAIAAALSDGARDLENIYLSCLNDPTGTPCGACRQLIAELMPDGLVWMDRGENPPECASSAMLLPGAFAAPNLSLKT